MRDKTNWPNKNMNINKIKSMNQMVFVNKKVTHYTIHYTHHTHVLD
jgi:hypothetical protein